VSSLRPGCISKGLINTPLKMATHNLAAGEYTTTISGLTIHYTIRTSSTGLPPLIVHPPPWGCGVDVYYSTFARLESKYTLIYPQPRGNDSSQKPDDPSQMSSRHIVDDLDLFRQHLGLEKISVLGHSSGGTIALGYAIAYPDKVDKLVLLDTDLLGYTRKDASFFADVTSIQTSPGVSVTNDAEFKAFVVKILPLYFAHPENGGPEQFEQAWSNTTASLWAYGAYYGADKSEAGKWDQFSELGKVQARKTLVLVGKQDRCCGVEVSEAVAQGVKGSQLVVIDDCGHFPWVEAAEEFWKVLEGFLSD
jgi:proline iminopeptidase